MTAERSLTPSTLGRLVGKSPTDPAKIRQWRAEAWHLQEIPVLPLDEIKNPIDRQVVIQIAERLYGKRISGPNTKEANNGKRQVA